VVVLRGVVKARRMTDGAAVDLVLASASPRRRELLGQLGLVLEVIPANVDETPRPGERPADYVRRVAAAKCEAIAAARSPDLPAIPIVAADTIVVVDDQIFGQPTDDADAGRMLRALAARRHEVTTAYRISFAGRTLERSVTTTVSFRSLQPAEVDAYLASGEWRGKAGGYAVQGRAGAFTIELRGSHTNVIGLPLAELLADLQALEALPRYPPRAFGVRPQT
jgi:septum formation protein